MFSDAEIELLARDILREEVERIHSWGAPLFHEIQEMDGELIPSYGATSTEGYGSFLCEYMPLAAVKKIIIECERIFDNFTIKVSDKQGASAERKIADGHLPESRAESIKMMAGFATLHFISSFRQRLCDVLEETVKDGELVAKSVLAAVAARAVEKHVPGKITADARAEIDKAAQRVADKKRLLLRETLKGLPPVIAQRRRGAPSKTLAQRATEAEAYAVEVEITYRKLRLEDGKAPTKTKVARELGAGGLNPKTGVDSSLSAFNNKLGRLSIDYDAIARKVETELNNNS